MKLFIFISLFLIVFCDHSLRKKKGPTIVHTPVILGYTQEKHVIQRTNPITGKSVTEDVYEQGKPILGTIHQVKNVITSHDQFVDLKSGKRLDFNEPLALHGYNNRRKFKKRN